MGVLMGVSGSRLMFEVPLLFPGCNEPQGSRGAAFLLLGGPRMPIGWASPPRWDCIRTVPLFLPGCGLQAGSAR